MAKAKKTKKSTKTRKAKKAAATTRRAAKRTTIAPRGDTRYVRRDPAGRIAESDDQGRSLARDTRSKAKRKVKAGHGDRGDR